MQIFELTSVSKKIKPHIQAYLIISLDRNIALAPINLVLKVLVLEICTIKLEFAKKVIIQSQITITFYV